MFEARPTDDVQADGPLLVNSPLGSYPNLGPVSTYPVAGMRWASPFEWLYTIGLLVVAGPIPVSHAVPRHTYPPACIFSVPTVGLP